MNTISQKLSFVIPAMNEEKTIDELFVRIREVCDSLNASYQIVFIDDGSTDGTWSRIRELAELYPYVQGIKFKRNFGKARALSAGFAEADGDIVFTMDADLQDDPKEIPNFIYKLNEGYDLVSGYKKIRHDPWHKVLPSRIFNRMLSYFSGVSLHDHNCGFKCYRRAVVEKMKLYGEMHRMVPALSGIEGFKVTEIVVKHHARRHGVSKYGISRFLRGFMDMLTVSFLKNYRERPLHLFGGIALLALIAGSTTLLYGLYLQSTNIDNSFIQTGLNVSLSSVFLMVIGLVTELMISGRRGYKSDFNIEEKTNTVAQNEIFVNNSNTIAFDPFHNRKGDEVEIDSNAYPINVVIVDDTYSDRRLLKHYLSELELNLSEASDGEQGLKLIGADTHAVLLDLNMPNMNGYEFLKQAQLKNPHLKVIVTSSESHILSAVETMKLGAFDHLLKPLDKETVTKTLKKAVNANLIAKFYRQLVSSF